MPKHFTFEVSKNLLPVGELAEVPAMIAKNRGAVKYFLFRDLRGSLDTLPKYVRKQILELGYSACYLGNADSKQIYVGMVPL